MNNKSVINDSMLDVMRQCLFSSRYGCDIAYEMANKPDIWDSLSIITPDYPVNKTEECCSYAYAIGFHVRTAVDDLGKLYLLLNQFSPTSVTVGKFDGNSVRVTASWHDKN